MPSANQNKDQDRHVDHKATYSLVFSRLIYFFLTIRLHSSTILVLTVFCLTVTHILPGVRDFMLIPQMSQVFICFLFPTISTFLSNMKAFGLSKDICKEFLLKMSTIGELNQGRLP